MRLKIYFLLIFVLLSLTSVFSQQLTLFPDLLVNGDPYINAIAQTAGGAYLIASRVDHVNGIPCGNLAKVDASGNLLSTFNKVIVDEFILKIASLADGKILVGGRFQHLNGVATSFARLNADGTIDGSFQPFPAVSSNYVSTFEVQADGKIILAGAFSVSGYSSLIRLNPDGSVDHSFATVNASSGYASNMVFDDNQNIFVSDEHTLFKLDKDGNPLPGFPVAVNPEGYFQTLCKFGGKVVIAGEFASVAGVARQNIAVINGDGTIDSRNWASHPFISDLVVTSNGDFVVNDLNTVTVYDSFGVNLGEIASDAPGKLFEDSSGGLLIAGTSILTAKGTPRPFLARLGPGYVLDNSFLCRAIYTNGIKAIVSQPDGKILLGGDYSMAGVGISTKRLVRIRPDGSPDNSFDPALATTDFVRAMDIQPDGKILVCTDKLLRLNKSGSLDNAFLFADQSEALTKVKFDNNAIYLSGDFNTIAGSPNRGIVKLKMDGSPDNTFVSGLPVNSFVTAFALQSDKKVIVAGNINRGGDIQALLRLNADGTLDNSFSVGHIAANGIWRVAVDSADQIYISGDFTEYNGTIYSRFLRLLPNGDIDNSYDPAVDFEINSTVYGLELLSNNEVVLGANVSNAQPSITVKDKNGNAVDKSFTHLGINSSTSATYFDGYTLYIGGRMVTQDQQLVSGIAYVNVNPAGGNVNGFQAVRNGPSVAQLSWTNNYTRAALLVLERSTANDQNFVAIDSLPPLTVSYDDSKTTAGTAYYYRIKAINTSSSTGYSAEAGIAPATSQTIDFEAVPAKTEEDYPFFLSAQASSGLPVSFSSTSNLITLSGNQVTITGPGRVSIKASQSGEGDFDAAPSVEQTFCINPAKPVINVVNLPGHAATLTSSAPAGNQWFLNNVAIAGATGTTFIANESGVYSLQVHADDCMSVFADDANLVVTGDIKFSSPDAVNISPNPVSDWLTISFGSEAQREICIFQIDGRQVESISAQSGDVQLNVGEYARGLYIIKVRTENAIVVKKLVKK